MTPIESRDDLRLVTVLALAMEVIETMALEFNIEPEQLLAENLYIITKRISNIGTEPYMNKLCTNYEILDEVLD